MRSTRAVLQLVGPHTYHRFCHVCRYILADTLNVVAHARIDREYPEPRPTPT